MKGMMRKITLRMMMRLLVSVKAMTMMMLMRMSMAKWIMRMLVMMVERSMGIGCLNYSCNRSGTALRQERHLGY
eukprot:5342478-Pyramimonas_sp.AAC.1